MTSSSEDDVANVSAKQRYDLKHGSNNFIFHVAHHEIRPLLQPSDLSHPTFFHPLVSNILLD